MERKELEDLMDKHMAENIDEDPTMDDDPGYVDEDGINIAAKDFHLWMHIVCPSCLSEFNHRSIFEEHFLKFHHVVIADIQCVPELNKFVLVQTLILTLSCSFMYIYFPSMLDI